MTGITSHIESSPTPSIKSLKSKFERFALDSGFASTSGHPKSSPSLSGAAVVPQGPAVIAPKPVPTFRSRMLSTLTQDDCTPQSQSAGLVCDLHSKLSASDLRAAAQKRGPPPPPPPRTKKPPSSPVSSPLLRPVPVPAALRSPTASPEPKLLSVRDNRASGGEESGSDDGSIVNVASLRNIFATQVPNSSAARSATPKLPPRPSMTTSYSDSVVTENIPIPPRNTNPDHRAQSPSLDPPVESFSPSILATDGSPRAGHVAAMRDRLALNDVSGLPSCPDNTSPNEPNILVTSPSIYPVRRTPRSLNAALFAKEDSLDIPSSSNSSIYSPFSDAESEISEISEVSLSSAIHSAKASGSGEFTSINSIPRPYHETEYTGGSGDCLTKFPSSKPRPPPRPSSHVPRLPQRSDALAAPSGPHESSAMAAPARPVAPPLPSRRPTREERTTEAPSLAPPLPARRPSLQNDTLAPVETPSLARDRKHFARLPPPPTRTIGLGDKLPPVRRTHTLSSDEESGSEEDPRFRSAELLPDSSRSWRRPPTLSCASLVECKVPAHSGYVASAGSGMVVASGHQIKYYDLSSGGGSSWTLDTRDGMRGCVVSCVEFKPVHDIVDRGQYLWVGTKEGHLFEVDTKMGIFTSSKLGIHASQVTQIFRQGYSMISVDETGKTFIFDPSNNGTTGVGADSSDDVHLIYTAPRVYRLGDKVEFVKLLGGLLWTSVRTDLNGASVPVIRIYDIYAPGSVGRPVTPIQCVGVVTSGTVLPSQHDHVYLGHEGGFISIWKMATDDGIPTCIEVVKVSTSDVLCLEGVNDRLWAGGRKGTISVYDVQAKPWVVTNCWNAHGGLPVSRIFVDPYAVVLREKLCVVSVGRDEQIRFWDGLLGVEHIERELLKREHTFSTFRDLKVLIVSWNIDSAKPESLVGDPENGRFLHNVLTSVDSPDVISFGFQEVIDLESSKMAAKTILLGGKRKGDEGKINEKVTSSYRRWHDRLVQAVKLAMPPETPYTVVHTESLVGLFTCIFVKNTQRASLRNPAVATLKRGMGGRYGNKGGIIARLLVDDSSLCFINCHLAAGQHHVRQRNADVAALLEETGVFPAESTEELGYVGGGDGSMVLDHEIVFLNGDLNYRIDQHRDAVIASIEANDLDTLSAHDQLHKEMKHNRAFRLRAFHEGPLTFVPTYKYDRHADVFDTSEKRRVPAWCDRVLWRSREEARVRLMDYRRWEPNVSDHRPISASFQVTVKRVVGEAREREKRVVADWWDNQERSLLGAAKSFYEPDAA